MFNWNIRYTATVHTVLFCGVSVCKQPTSMSTQSSDVLSTAKYSKCHASEKGEKVATEVIPDSEESTNVITDNRYGISDVSLISFSAVIFVRVI